MASLQAEQDIDLLGLTLHNLGEYKWTDAVSLLQDYIFLSHIFTKYKAGFQSGTSIDTNVMVNPSSAAAMVGIGAPDKVNITDSMTKANVPWRMANTNYAFDLGEVAMNREPSRIVDLVKTRRSNAMIGLAELLETQGWSQPSGTNDNLNTMGVPHWIVPNQTQGFNGGNPFGFAAGAGGISSSAYPNWANYTDQYVDPTKLDMIRKMRRAAYFTSFLSPVNADVPSYGAQHGPGTPNPKRGMYTTYYVFERIVEAAEQQNDNLGNDVASKDGKGTVQFHRNPVNWVPKLQTLSGQGMGGTFSNTTYAASGGYPVNPIYLIDWNTMMPVFLKGWWMREVGPYELRGIQHTMAVVQIDIRYNTLCRDRRRQAVLTQ